MLSDDVYRSRLQETVAGLKYWAPKLRHAAEISETETERFWHMSARPQVAGACPFDLVLHRDARFDLMVGGEIYEDEPVEDLTLFEPLLDAIARGAVLTRTWTTAATGARRLIETIISPQGRPTWQRGRTITAIASVDLEHCIQHDRHYVPYWR